MFECARFFGKTIKKSKNFFQILDTVVRIVVTFLEEGRDRGRTVCKGGFWGAGLCLWMFCILTNHCYIVLFFCSFVLNM